jgi:hypothetical protein
MHKNIICILGIICFSSAFTTNIYASSEKIAEENLQTDAINEAAGKAKKEEAADNTGSHTDSEKKVKFLISGDVLFGLRLDILRGTDSSGKVLEPTQGDYTNRYAWSVKAKAIVSENLFLAMRLSNPSGYFTDDVLSNLGLQSDSSESKVLEVPEAYFQWKYKRFSLAAGILPVPGNAVLNLVAYESVDYQVDGMSLIGEYTWKERLNNSQIGLNLGYNLKKNESNTIGIDLVTAIADNNGMDNIKDALINDQIRFILSLPMILQDGKFILLPVTHMVTNVYKSNDLNSMNHSFTAGAEVRVDPIEQFNINFGFAIGGYKNSSLEDDSGYIPMALKGMINEAGISFKPPYGTGVVDLRFGQLQDTKADTIISRNLLHFDIKYLMPVKRLTFIPRLRIWRWNNSNNNDKTTLIRLYPELLFTCKF